MLWAKRFCNPDHLFGTDTGRIGKDLAQMLVVGLFQLIFNDDLIVTIRTKDVELEITYPVLTGNMNKFTKPKRVCQHIKIVWLREPGREITGFVPPCFS